jgi:ribonuclease HI
MAIKRNDGTGNPKNTDAEETAAEGENLSLIWVQGHKGIASNEQVGVEAKIAFEDKLHPTLKIPPQDLIKWLTTKAK